MDPGRRHGVDQNMKPHTILLGIGILALVGAVFATGVPLAFLCSVVLVSLIAADHLSPAPENAPSTDA